MSKRTTSRGTARPRAAPKAGRSSARGSVPLRVYRRRLSAKMRRRLAFFGRMGRRLAVAAGVAFVALLGVFGFFALDMPTLESIRAQTKTSSITVLDASGNLIGSTGVLFGAPVRLDDVSPHLPKAVLAAEDRRFYHHVGVDPVGLSRALIANARSGRIVQGGSTISQQLAKNLFLTPERTIKRKIQEVMLALWLEVNFTKDEILTLYLNRVYFGAGAYGVEAASRQFFNKPALSLTLNESAMLAGLLKAPSRYNPRANIDLARERARLVLAAMEEAGFLTADDLAQAQSQAPQLREPAHVEAVQYFVDWVNDLVPDYVGQSHDDLIVRTTLHWPFQQAAQRAIENHLNQEGGPSQASQAALVSIDTDGAVRALVGGRAYSSSQYNRVIQAKRQPGSAFKPFVYLAALEQGFTQWDVVEDQPVTFAKWSPANFSNKYKGPVTLREALSQSINSVAAQLADWVGPPAVTEVAARLGIGSEIEPVLSISLGTEEVSLMELTSAYVPFANGGFGVFPHAILEIKTRDGEILYQRTGSGPGQVVAPRHVGAMNDMLSETMRSGTGRGARLEARVSAGKSGTSQSFRDAWFVGYTADLVTGVWVGNDNGDPMKRVTGGGLPARIWKSFMTPAATAYEARALPHTKYYEPEPEEPMWRTAEHQETTLFDRLLSRIARGLSGAE